MSAPEFRQAITAFARAEGFEAVGFADATQPWPASGRLEEFIASGRHGTMTWMETTLERRAHPMAMWPEARSAIMLGRNYGPDLDPLEALARTDRAAVSVYAQGDDYHDVVKKALKALAGRIQRLTGGQVKVFVDTAPLMEKPLAQAAGLGWQGKHTNLVSREHGSWLFLGAILTDAAIAPDEPEADHCGTCTACLDICPTCAFPAPYQLDARRCISYLTIEHAGPIPHEFRAAMGNRVYGCDDCLAVCPWNKFATQAADIRLQARDGLGALELSMLAGLDDAAFRALFARNPIKRIGVARFLRNVALAIGNSQDPGLVPHAIALSGHDSALVRGAAAWALRQLMPASAMEALAQEALARETDPIVRAEWSAPA